MASPRTSSRRGTGKHEPGDPITLVGLLVEAAAGLRRVLAPALESELGVGGQSFDLLVRLARSEDGRLRMSDLAAQSGLTPSGLSRAVDRLVEEGLAGRESCPSDRRGTFARLTPLGRERMEEALARHARAVDELLEGVLRADERLVLAALLRRLRDRVHPEASLVSPDATPETICEAIAGGVNAGRGGAGGKRQDEAGRSRR